MMAHHCSMLYYFQSVHIALISQLFSTLLIRIIIQPHFDAVKIAKSVCINNAVKLFSLTARCSLLTIIGVFFKAKLPYI